MSFSVPRATYYQLTVWLVPNVDFVVIGDEPSKQLPRFRLMLGVRNIISSNK